VIQLAVSRSKRVSVVLTLMAVLPTWRYSVMERTFCFGTFLVGCGSSAFWQRLADFNILKITYFNISSKQHLLYDIETNDKRWEVEPVEAKRLMQPAHNVMKCLPPFLSPQSCFALFVGLANTFTNSLRSKLSLGFAYLRA